MSSTRDRESNRKPLAIAAIGTIVLSILPACLTGSQYAEFAILPLLLLIVWLSLKPHLPSISLGVTVSVLYIVYVFTRYQDDNILQAFLLTGCYVACAWLVVFVNLKQLATIVQWRKTRSRFINSNRKKTDTLRRMEVELENEKQSFAEAAKRLQDSRKQQTDLIGNLEVSVFHKDRDGKFIFVSQSFADFIGQQVDEIIGASDFDLFDRERAIAYRSVDAQVIQNQVPIDRVEDNVNIENQVRHLRVRKAPLYDSHGNVCGIQGMFWDITEHYDNSLKLQESASRKKALFIAAADSILFFDAHLEVIEMNLAAEQKFEVECEEKDDARVPIRKGLSFEDLMHAIHPIDFAGPATSEEKSEFPNFAQELDDEGFVSMAEFDVVEVFRIAQERCLTAEFIGQKGERFFGEMSAHPIRVDGSTGWAVFVRDISLQRRNEKKLLAAMQNAEEANRAKDAFLANISHEVRTPLAAMTSIIELLQESRLPPKSHEYANLMAQSADGLSALIDDLLDFSKLDSAQFQLDPQLVCWPAFVERTISVLLARAASRGIDFTLDIEDSSPWLVEIDPKRLGQVFANIIGNSIKFTESGEVSVRSFVERESHDNASTQTPLLSELVVEFRDTGIGIDESKLDVIFEPFQQADSSMTRRFGGTGLGLSISRNIAELCGGSLRCIGGQEVGTLFELRLPLPNALQIRDSIQYGDYQLWSHLSNVTESTMQKLSENILTIDDNSIRSVRGESSILDNVSCFLLIDDDQRQKSQIESLNNRLAELKLVAQLLHSVDALRQKVRNSTSEVILVFAFVASEMESEVMDSVASWSNVRWIWLHQFNTLLPNYLDRSHPECANDFRFSLLPIPIKLNALFSALEQSVAKVAPLATEPLGTEDSTIQGSEASDNLQSSTIRVAHVLLVEDSLMNRVIQQEVLQKLGHTFHVACDGEEAIRQYESNRYDLVLMDVQMPNMDGISATRKIREFEEESFRRTPIFALTAHAFEEDRKKCMAAGMDGYLVKPVDMRTLQAVIQNVLERRSDLGEISSANLNPSATNVNNPESNVLHEFEAGIKYLQENSGGNPAYVGDLLSAFCQEMPQRYGDLVDALDQGEYSDATRAAHTIASNFRYFGANMLWSKFKAIERFCRDQNTKDAELIRREIDASVRQFLELAVKRLPNQWRK